MKKIMILGAGIYQMPIINKAMERGLYTIAVSPKGDYPGLNVADKAYYIDVRDEKSVLAAARKEGIDAVTTDQTDIAVRTVAYVAEHMGLSGIGYECARLFTDKAAMRRRTEELGLPAIKSKAVYSLKEAITFFNECDGKIMIKPVDNQGSRGVFMVDSEEELADKFSQSVGFSKDGKVIAEQFVEGKEFEVDSIVVNGKARTLMCGDVDLFKVPGIFASRTRIYPSNEEPEILKKLLETNRLTIEGFGLNQGLTHSEYLINEKGMVYLIEAAARGGGAFVSSHVTKLQTGLDTADFLIDAALGQVNDYPKFERNLCHCGCLSFYLPQGEVVSLEGIEEAKTKPYIFDHFFDNIYIGMKTEAFSDKTSRYVTIIQADSRDSLEAYIDEIRNILKIKVKTYKGIEGPVWE